MKECRIDMPFPFGTDIKGQRPEQRRLTLESPGKEPADVRIEGDLQRILFDRMQEPDAHPLAEFIVTMGPLAAEPLNARVQVHDVDLRNRLPEHHPAVLVIAISFNGSQRADQGSSAGLRSSLSAIVHRSSLALNHPRPTSYLILSKEMVMGWNLHVWRQAA